MKARRCQRMPFQVMPPDCEFTTLMGTAHGALEGELRADVRLVVNESEPHLASLDDGEPAGRCYSQRPQGAARMRQHEVTSQNSYLVAPVVRPLLWPARPFWSADRETGPPRQRRLSGRGTPSFRAAGTKRPADRLPAQRLLSDVSRNAFRLTPSLAPGIWGYEIGSALSHAYHAHRVLSS